MRKPKLIVASARLPVTMSRRQDSWEAATSTGGLVTALKSVAERRPFTWLGWPGTPVPEAEHKRVRKVLAKHGSLPVFLTKSETEGFYEGFSNRVLWPLFHNLGDRTHFDPQGWRAYKAVNEKFAKAIEKAAEPGDFIWVHDYQLARVPELLRLRGVTCPIGFFLHIPFPSAETYRSLPVRGSILNGLLGADLLAFHSYEYISHFRNACLRVLGIESEPELIRLSSHSVRLAQLPIGIDPAEITEMARGAEAKNEYESVRASHPGKTLIIGVDRLDYTKGIPQKLLGFEELLRAHPKWRNRVVLIQIAAPSRTAVSEYQQLKRQVDELVGRINGRYGTSAGAPIVYVNQNVSRERLVGLFQASEIALITPVRDGMNLVALEYIAARGSNPGSLILSEFAGAAHCLPGARLVNPHSVMQVAEALNEALEKRPTEASFRHMREFVETNTAMTWSNSFLDQLEAAAVEPRPPVERLDVELPPISKLVSKATKPLFFLDYDGTLRSYVLKPDDATPGDRVRKMLTDLGARATVYIVSGRTASTLEQWLGDLPVGLVCEHGLAIKPPHGEWLRNKGVSGPTLKKIVQPLFEEFTQRTPGSTIEQKTAALAWHYRGADPEFGTFQAKELLALLEDSLRKKPFSVLRGARVIEVRYAENTKGHAARELLKTHSDADFLFVAGDDRTDEEMMDAIPKSWHSRAVTCWVGQRNAHAHYWVQSNMDLIGQLEQLARVFGEKKPSRTRSSKKRSSRRSSTTS